MERKLQSQEELANLQPQDKLQGFDVRPGFYEMYGATAFPNGVNFTIISFKATACTLLLFHRKERQRVLQNGVDHRLIVLDAVVDNVVKAVIVFDLHAVEVVAVVIIGELFDAVHRLYAREVDPDEHEYGGQKHRHDSAEREQRDFQRLFHPVSPFSFEPGTRFVLFLLQRRASARLRWFHLGDCMLDIALLYMNIRPKGKNLQQII